MKAKVVYFSRTGKNKRVAEAIAQALTDDGNTVELERIETTKPGATLVFGVAMSVLKIPAKLVDPPSVDDGDLLVLVSPVWASSMCPAIRAFLATLPDLQGRTVLNVVCGYNAHESVARSINHEIKRHNAGTIVMESIRLRDVETPENLADYAHRIAKKALG